MSNQQGFSTQANRQTDRHDYDDRVQVELAKLTEKWKDKRVLITDLKHPHSGEIGTVTSFAIANDKVAMIVKGDYNSFYVFNINMVKEI